MRDGIPDIDREKNGGLWEQFLNRTRSDVVDADLLTRRIRCSAALVRSLRLTPETLPRTLDQWIELCHPEDYSRNRELLQFLEGPEENFSLERRLYCGDGRYRRFRLDAFCLCDPLKRTTRMIGTETDLSQREFGEHRLTGLQAAIRELQTAVAVQKERAEDLAVRLARKDAHRETLERQLHQARRLSDATPDLLFHRDENGQLLLCNDAFSRAAADDPDLMRRVRDVRDGDECRRKDRHGRLRSLEAHVYPFLDCYGKMTGEIGAFCDKTEAGEAETEMLRLRRLLWRNRERPGEAAEFFRYSYLDGEDCDLLDSREILGGYLNGALRSIRAASAMTGSALFPSRTEQLEDLLRITGGEELEVGIVGITSSGKSTFINAMMGERLLPEETRATTNLLVRCRKGEKRAVNVVLKNGESRYVSGPELTAAWMESLTSERLNPANEQGIALLEWTSPGAALPAGLVLIDTPGLDACGFPEHSELVLRRLLPSLDIVLYVTSIRSRFKIADIELLKALLEQDQRVIFLLSQIDLEQDDTEGGKIVLSRRQKLAACMRELREDIGQEFPGSPAVVPVSSKLAIRHFYDRNSPAWTASNFGPLIRQMEAFQSNLHRYRAETRSRRALSLLSRTESDVLLALGDISTEQAEAEGAARLDKIRELRDAWRWANAEVSAARNECRRLIDPEHHAERLRKEMSSLLTLRRMKDRYEHLGTEWPELIAQITDRMDRARLSCRDLLQKYGIAPRERVREVPDIKSELPAFYRYVLHEAREVRVRGWFENLEFWPRYQTFFRQDVDTERLMSDLMDVLTERLRLLDDHLSWWENRMREDYCDLLYEELSGEEVALADIRRVATDASVSRSALRQALSGVREAGRGIRGILSDLSLPDIDPESLFSEDLFDRLGDPTVADASDEHEEPGLFTPLLAAFQEQNLLSRFLEIEGLRHRRIVLLGLRRHDSVRFLSRLAHDSALVDSLRAEDGGELDEQRWLFCGTTPPALPHVSVSVPETLLREIEILIAPGDGFLDACDWNDLFAEWLPVVHLDIARIDSGLSDLARAPYSKALAHVERWIAASGQGALFNGRLSDLLTDVPQRLDDFCLRREHRGQVDLFVYENYDARYTDFIIRSRRSDLDDAALIETWIREGHDFAPPFSEHRLRRALEAARRKRETE